MALQGCVEKVHHPVRRVPREHQDGPLDSELVHQRLQIRFLQLGEIGLDPERITPTDSASFVRPAPRPAYSVLGHDAWARTGLAPMRDWREALHDAARAGATDPVV
jgi:hypothetical protein